MLVGDAAEAFATFDRGGGAVIVQPDDQTRVAIVARDFAKLTPAERDQTLVLDPAREGRQRLTDTIRAALARDGTLGEDAVVASVLEPRGLRRADAAHARSYRPGDVVAFRKGDRHEGFRRYIPYRVEGVDGEAGIVRLSDPAKGKAVDWRPAQWGSAQAEAFTEVEQEFRAGDKVQFTRNNYRAARLNGHTASVVAVDAQGSSMMVERENGRRQTLDLPHVADRHIRPGWVRTIQSAQGATADRVSMRPPSMPPSAGPRTTPASTPTAAPTSQPRSVSAPASRSGPSTRCGDEPHRRSPCPSPLYWRAWRSAKCALR